MITCPSCNHQNPEGSLQCENCYTPLPATTSCPNCGASVQTDATFCGQCGFNLQAENSIPVLEETTIDSLLDNTSTSEEVSSPDEMPLSETDSDILPETVVSLPIQSPWDEELDSDYATAQQMPEGFPDLESTEMDAPLDETEISEVKSDSTDEVTLSRKTDTSDLDRRSEPAEVSSMNLSLETEPADVDAQQKETIAEYVIPFEGDAAKISPSEENVPNVGTMAGATQLQMPIAYLLHLQSDSKVEIPYSANIVHIGKPNAQIPPDIDVAGFPNSEVVSRVHADIRVEGDAYYIEDTGSSNGTYINHTPLPKGNRHRLRVGDRIALGKGDLVTFIFQMDKIET